jgi:hypothetical protein
MTIRGQCGIYITVLPDCDNSAAWMVRPTRRDHTLLGLENLISADGR